MKSSPPSASSVRAPAAARPCPHAQRPAASRRASQRHQVQLALGRRRRGHQPLAGAARTRSSPPPTKPPPPTPPHSEAEATVGALGAGARAAAHRRAREPSCLGLRCASASGSRRRRDLVGRGLSDHRAVGRAPPPAKGTCVLSLRANAETPTKCLVHLVVCLTFTCHILAVLIDLIFSTPPPLRSLSWSPYRVSGSVLSDFGCWLHL